MGNKHVDPGYKITDADIEELREKSAGHELSGSAKKKRSRKHKSKKEMPSSSIDKQLPSNDKTNLPSDKSNIDLSGPSFQAAQPMMSNEPKQ